MGCIGDLGKIEEDLFKDLLVLDTLRGLDSTGVIAVNANKEVDIAKVVGDPFQLFDSGSFTKIMRQKNTVLIGHNRAATVGKSTRKNAHPFEFDGVVGVHNGTLRNKHAIPQHLNFDTDSEALYNHINNVGVDEAIKIVNGAYSLVWYDKNKHTVNFLRNDERPMNLVFSKDRKKLFFASEVWMVSAVTAREKYEMGEHINLPEDTLYSFEIPKVGTAFEKAKVRHVKSIPFVQKAVAPTTATVTSIVSVKKKEVEGQKSTAIALSLMFRPGDEVDDLVPDFYNKNSFGAYYVVFTSASNDDVLFRCYMPTVKDCQELVLSDNKYKATVAFAGLLDGKSVEVKLAPSSLTLLQNHKGHKDHKGITLTEEEFKKRYTECAWCSSNISFEDEEFFPIGFDSCICDNCVEMPTVKPYLNNLCG